MSEVKKRGRPKKNVAVSRSWFEFFSLVFRDYSLPFWRVVITIAVLCLLFGVAPNPRKILGLGAGQNLTSPYQKDLTKFVSTTAAKVNLSKQSRQRLIIAYRLAITQSNNSTPLIMRATVRDQLKKTHSDETDKAFSNTLADRLNDDYENNHLRDVGEIVEAYNAIIEGLKK
jgi:hypothetical protein